MDYKELIYNLIDYAEQYKISMGGAGAEDWRERWNG